MQLWKKQKGTTTKGAKPYPRSHCFRDKDGAVVAEVIGVDGDRRRVKLRDGREGIVTVEGLTAMEALAAKPKAQGQTQELLEHGTAPCLGGCGASYTQMTRNGVPDPMSSDDCPRCHPELGFVMPGPGLGSPGAAAQQQQTRLRQALDGFSEEGLEDHAARQMATLERLLGCRNE